jgi:hypothetical protein
VVVGIATPITFIADAIASHHLPIYVYSFTLQILSFSFNAISPLPSCDRAEPGPR